MSLETAGSQCKKLQAQGSISTVKRRPAVLRALGDCDPPQSVEIAGRVFELEEIFKHDSWAATALYQSRRDPEMRAVCKFNRTQPVFFIPMCWLGRLLAKREAFAFKELFDVAGIPRWSGMVRKDGIELTNAVAHEFVPGRPLQSEERVGDDFFLRLKAILEALHQAGFAYVDLHKRENVIVDVNGHPALIDFQISMQPAPKWIWKLPGMVSLLRLFQSTDRFCLYKHVRNSRADQIGLLGLSSYERIPWWIRMHRMIAVPFRQARRRLLSWLRIRNRAGASNSEFFPEHAFRES
ncbi:MAG: hypothetical protein VXZ82_00185 [Planctomycetota bacterium]|nr:hypothetical protein [Planctomycetota bacterium]